ncbi:unnamed protein product [Diamesa serratosioi]
MLSGNELITGSKKLEEFTLLSRGLKLKFRENGIEEDVKIEENRKNLKELLNLERIAPQKCRAHGSYESENNRILITKVEGKWTYGYSENNLKYLEPYEALFLIEMNRLEVEFDSVIVSVEQAYAIFLDPANDVSYSSYLVYSFLWRAGYFVFKHDSQADTLKYEAFILKQKNQNEQEMIFNCLFEKLNLPVTNDLIQNEPQLYKSTKALMDECSERIRNSVGDNNKIENQMTFDNKRKRIMKDEISPKKIKSEELPILNFLDFLKTEVEYSTNLKTFEKIDMIKKAVAYKSKEQDKLRFVFDIYIPKLEFKKNVDLPNYRILVKR